MNIDYIELNDSLMSYIEEACQRTGEPMSFTLIMAYPKDPKVYVISNFKKIELGRLIRSIGAKIYQHEQQQNKSSN